MKTEHKIKLIKSVVEGKDVVLIGNSPTVSSLVKNRELFKKTDFVYGSLGHWVPIERDFLLPIGLNLDILHVHHRSLPRHQKSVRKFVRNANILIVDKEEILPKDIDSRYVFDFIGVAKEDKHLPSYKHFCLPSVHSIMQMVAVVSCGCPRSIFVFGCDGGVTADFDKDQIKQCHYGCDKNCTNPYRHKYKRQIIGMVECFDSLMVHMAKVFDFKIPPTYIAGEHSRYRFGERVTAKKIFDLMGIGS